MKIAIGKMGRSMFFNRNRWKDGAGNYEAPLLFSKIAKLNPQNTYYIIGKSDFSRVSDEIRQEWFPHNNVIDCWADWKAKEDDPTTWITKVLKDVDIDYCIIHGGMVSLSIPDRIYCLDRKTKEPIVGKMRKPIQSLVNYVSPITYYLNETGVDWITVTSDGRYQPMQARDLLNTEKISLGVREGISIFERMKSYEDQFTMVEKKVINKYAAAEFQYMLDDRWNQMRDAKKTQKFAIFFHKYDNKRRIKDLEDFVINNFNDDELAVYGKWKDYEGKKFKGSVTFDELQEILPTVKYTFCYPIIPGDISGKWVEASVNGMIPFFHDSYDKDRILVSQHGIPEWFFVSTPEELRKKVDFLESNKDAYERARNIFRKAVDQDKYRTGEHFNDMINMAIDYIKLGKKSL